MARDISVSIVMPTFKRLPLLRRAVESVYRQTTTEWELIITDDEFPPGETWQFLSELASSDSRIRVAQNPGPHGQCGNANHGLRLARGRWIKLLYDDDILRPTCLEVLLEAVGNDMSIALATCLVDRYSNGSRVKSGNRGNRARIERLPRRTVHLALYLGDVEVGMPTQVLVNRSGIEAGVLLEEVSGISCAVDTWWFTRLLRQGDLLMVNEVLAEEHQGFHETVSRGFSHDDLDREMETLKELTFPFIHPACHPPPIRVAKQSLQLVRALYRLRQREPGGAIQLAATAWHPQAWLIATRWVLRRAFPGRFEIVQRTVVEV